MAESEVKVLTADGEVITVQGTLLPPEFVDENVGGMSIVDSLKMLQQWGPFLMKLKDVALAASPRDKALAILDALEVAAGKTTTTIDDEVVAKLEAALKTPEGGQLFDYLVSLASFIKVVA